MSVCRSVTVNNLASNSKMQLCAGNLRKYKTDNVIFFLFSVFKYIKIKPLPELIKSKVPSSILNTDTYFLYCCSSYIFCRSYLALPVCLSICIYSLFLFVRFFCICFYLPLALFSTVLWKCFIENKDKLFIGVI